MLTIPRTVDIPRPAEPLDPALADTRMALAFADAVMGASDWNERAERLDDLLAYAVAYMTARSADAYAITGCCYVAVTHALERLDKRSFKEPQAACCYLFATHREWRQAAREFLAGYDTAALLRARPGFWLLGQIAAARVAALDEAERPALLN
jgi:hypothetical protein